MPVATPAGRSSRAVSGIESAEHRDILLLPSPVITYFEDLESICPEAAGPLLPEVPASAAGAASATFQRNLSREVSDRPFELSNTSLACVSRRQQVDRIIGDLELVRRQAIFFDLTRDQILLRDVELFAIAIARREKLSPCDHAAASGSGRAGSPSQ
jgi:hypothetical protein